MLGWLRQYMGLQMLKVTVRAALDTFPSDKQMENAGQLSTELRDAEHAQASMTTPEFDAYLTTRIVHAYNERHRAMQERGESRKDPAWNLAHMQETWLGARLALLQSPPSADFFERVDALLRDFIAQASDPSARD
jgi:hypothetical protein